jgi:hypothetical protein
MTRVAGLKKGALLIGPSAVFLTTEIGYMLWTIF